LKKLKIYIKNKKEDGFNPSSFYHGVRDSEPLRKACGFGVGLLLTFTPYQK
jgi:hypothetical protein